MTALPSDDLEAVARAICIVATHWRPLPAPPAKEGRYMWNFPDLTPLFYLAAFGLFCAAVLVVGGGGWLAYHLFMALRLYIWGI